MMAVYYADRKDSQGNKYLISWDDKSLRPILPGLLSWIFLTIMAISAVHLIRRKDYLTFYIIHIVLHAPVIIFACIHDKWTFIPVLFAAFFHIADYVVSIYQGFFNKAKIIAMGTAGGQVTWL
eukprot:gene23291-1428_t